MIKERKRSMIERLDAMALDEQINLADEPRATVSAAMLRLKTLTGKEFTSRTFPDKTINVWRTK